MNIENKLCGRCSKRKPLTDFVYRWSRRRKDGVRDHNYYSPCRDCRNKKRKATRAKKPGYHRADFLRRKFNLTLVEYEDILNKQNGVCAICKKPETSKDRSGCVRPLSVDHCHKKNKVRALLCNKCNHLLGNANDDVSILESAISYLNSHS